MRIKKSYYVSEKQGYILSKRLTSWADTEKEVRQPSAIHEQEYSMYEVYL